MANRALRLGVRELLRLRQEKLARPPVLPGAVGPPNPVPAHIPRPSYARSGEHPPWQAEPQIHAGAALDSMRAACRLAARVLAQAGGMVQPGLTTDAIDRAVHDVVVEASAYPSPLNYGGFPKSVCTSVNEVICHGIPDSRELQEGDILNIDVTVFLDGYHGDTSAMFYVGTPPPDARALCEATREALHAGIAACGPGVPLQAIGAAVHRVARREGLGTVADFVGHGIGRTFHSAPQVLHCRNREPGVMVPGLTFTIEPMLTLGSPEAEVWADGWTAAASDGSLSAQEEHTVVIIEDGVEILTLREGQEELAAGVGVDKGFGRLADQFEAERRRRRGY